MNAVEVVMRMVVAAIVTAPTTWVLGFVMGEAGAPVAVPVRRRGGGGFRHRHGGGIALAPTPAVVAPLMFP